MEIDGGERKWKRRKVSAGEPSPSRWTVPAEQQIYCSRLLLALRGVRRPPAAAPRGRTIREAADRALAFSARGRSRWSRAILLSSRRAAAAARLKTAARRRLPRPPRPVSPPSSPFQRKARMLGSLVPGCRRLPLPALLEETSDYIAALQMQVRAMTALADALSAVDRPPLQ